MTRLTIRHALFAGLLLLFTATGLQAEHQKTLSRKTYRLLEEAQQLLDQGNSSKGLGQLHKLLDDTTGSAYEQSIVLQSIAHAHMNKGDYKAAIHPLERSIELQALPDDVLQHCRYNLSQLYMATDQYGETIKVINQWFSKAQHPTAEAYVLLGSAHLQLNQYKQAIKPLTKAIELSDKPNEGWYQSLLGAYYELKNYKQCTLLLQRMIRLFPEQNDYWKQLSAIEMSRNRTAQALAVMELAYLRDRINTERDLLNLAQLYVMRDAPYKAAQLIEDSIQQGKIKPTAKNWESAANAWYLAKEVDHATMALEKANNKDDKTKLSLRLAQLYLESRRWPEAIERLEKLVSKVQDKDKAQTWLLLGIARYENQLNSDAQKAFREASKFKWTHKDAKQWLAYLTSQD